MGASRDLPECSLCCIQGEQCSPWGGLHQIVEAQNQKGSDERPCCGCCFSACVLPDFVGFGKHDSCKRNQSQADPVDFAPYSLGGGGLQEPRRLPQDGFAAYSECAAPIET